MDFETFGFGNLISRVESHNFQNFQIDDSDNDFTYLEAYQSYPANAEAIETDNSENFFTENNILPEIKEEIEDDIFIEKEILSSTLGGFDNEVTADSENCIPKNSNNCPVPERRNKNSQSPKLIKDWKSILQNYNPVVLLERIKILEKTPEIPEVIELSDFEEIDVENDVNPEIRSNLITDYLEDLQVTSEDLGIAKNPQPEEKFYTCDFCSAKYCQERTYKQHLKSHMSEHPALVLRKLQLSESEKPFSCEKCGSKFAQKRYLSQHMRVHRPKKIIECKFCSLTFQHRSSLSRHMKSHESTKLPPKPFSQESPEIARNQQEKNSQGLKSPEKTAKLFSCPICPLKFRKKLELANHRRIHNKKFHTCEICSSQFSDSSRLKRHYLSHTGERSHACQLCGVKFLHKYHLNEHMRIHTGERPYACSVCSMKFRQSGTLKQHMRIHSLDKTFHCKICSVKFQRESQLNFHMRVHTSLKRKKSRAPADCQISCDDCKRIFQDKDELAAHMLLHTQERSLRCNVCLAKFFNKHNLKNHMRGHAKDKPFSCDICLARFSVQFLLDRHELAHSAEVLRLQNFRPEIC